MALTHEHSIDIEIEFLLQDEEYQAAGASIVSDKDAFGADIVLKVRPPKVGEETDKFSPGSRYSSSHEC